MPETPQERLEEENKRPKDVRGYAEVNVFILNWENEDLNHEKEIGALRRVFTQEYGYRVSQLEISEEEFVDEPAEQVAECLQIEMEDHDGPEILWIFIYTGHGYLSDDKTLMFAA